MKEIMQAILSKEVHELFERLGKLADLDSGLIVCHSCRDVITVQTFRAVTRHRSELMFACDKPECLAALAALRG